MTDDDDEDDARMERSLSSVLTAIEMVNEELKSPRSTEQADFLKRILVRLKIAEDALRGLFGVSEDDDDDDD